MLHKNHYIPLLLLMIFLASATVQADTLRNPRVSSGDVVTWDCVFFGNYFKDYEGNKAPIMWRVLSVNGNDAFLLADKSLDCYPYQTNGSAATWENSTLRNWLNSTFYNSAFNSSEKTAIKLSTVLNNDYEGIAGGNNTQDRIYLLSIDEAENRSYGFLNRDSLCTGNTDYAKQKGAKTYTYRENSRITWSSGTIDSPKYNGNGYWWLRSPGASSTQVSSVRCFGDIVHSTNTNDKTTAVRPCLHIDLGKSGWTYVGTISSDGTLNCANHIWSTYVISVEATKEKEGEKYCWCIVCGEEKTEVIPKLQENSKTKKQAALSDATKANPITVKAKKVKVSYKKLKKAKAVEKALTVKGAVGKVTYKKVSGSNKITVSKTGKITIKKKTKKGTYKIVVAVTASGNSEYKAATKNIIVSIKIK